MPAVPGSFKLFRYDVVGVFPAVLSQSMYEPSVGTIDCPRASKDVSAISATPRVSNDHPGGKVGQSALSSFSSLARLGRVASYGGVLSEFLVIVSCERATLVNSVRINGYVKISRTCKEYVATLVSYVAKGHNRVAGIPQTTCQKSWLFSGVRSDFPGAANQPFHFHLHKHACQFRHSEFQVLCDPIDRMFAAFQQLPNAASGFIEVWRRYASPANRLRGRRFERLLSLRGAPVQRFEHIIGIANERGAVANQLVAAGARRDYRPARAPRILRGPAPRHAGR